MPRARFIRSSEHARCSNQRNLKPRERPISSPPQPQDRAAVLQALLASEPLQRIRAAAEQCGSPLYIVGGAVRDALLGRRLGDLDLVVEGELGPLLVGLGAEGIEHQRFGTATIRLGGRALDLARSRRESYPRPGALPVVEPAPIRVDLARRDFTINALALPLGAPAEQAPPELIDPYDGIADLEAGLLRVIHAGSFSDDPTRALRAARYAARLGFGLEPETGAQLRATDLGTVSADRIAAEWGRIAAEDSALAAFSSLRDWGLLSVEERWLELAGAVDRIGSTPPWRDEGLRAAALIEALGAEPIIEQIEALAGARPARPSEAVELASAWERRPVMLLLARAAGAEWLDRWLTEWRGVRLRIDGSDLIERGVLAGPAMGRALKGTLAGVLDGEISDSREEQLEAALRFAASDQPS